MFKTPTEMALVVSLAVLVTYIFTRGQGASGGSASTPIVIAQPQMSAPPMIVKGGDDRYTRAPRPQRVWDNGPELPTRGSFNELPSIATRGAPEAYQQMGVLTTHDGKALPLYGRRTAPRSDYFNYYTRTDTYNPVALPVMVKKRDCQDNAGCQEVMSGDEVKLAATGEHAKVTLYGFDGPRYVG
jgi:hypothetical protein